MYSSFALPDPFTLIHALSTLRCAPEADFYGLHHPGASVLWLLAGSANRKHCQENRRLERERSKGFLPLSLPASPSVIVSLIPHTPL